LIIAVAGSFALAAPATAVPAAESALSWTIDPVEGGEPITGELTAPDATFQSLRSGTINRITVSGDGESWSIGLAAPVGEELHPGIYRNAERAGFQSGRAPGLEVTRGTDGCNEVFGRFSVHQIAFDATGTISMLEASFAQTCDGAPRVVRGNLKYQATPLSYRWRLTDDQPESPDAHTYRGATSTFFAQMFRTTGIRFGASGDRLDDIVEFAPPQGEQLVVGMTYRNAQPINTQQPGRAGLQAERLRCGPTTGTFTIHELVLGAGGEPIALSATFTLRCPDFPTPENPNTLRGTIHFNA
jgi:hypothetical protein